MSAETPLPPQPRDSATPGTVALAPVPGRPDAHELARKLQAQEQEISELRSRLIESETLLGHIEHSTAWRATAPLRHFFSTRPGARLLLRRAARILAGRTAAPAAPPGRVAARLWAATVPFAYLDGAAPGTAPGGAPSPTPGGAPAIAVICHLYYTDLAQELRGYLARIPYPYDLYLSTDSAAKQREIQDCFAAPAGGLARRVEVKVVENRGRDIAPKLLAWDHAYASHEYVLHLHTKKSLRAGGQLDDWRAYLLDTLLGSPAVVASVFEAFAHDPGLGMIAPDHLAKLRGGIGWTSNFARAHALARRFGVELDHDGPMDFPSGSMFWARSRALRPLLECGLALQDFEAETGQVDGTLAHAIERLYFFCCEKAGLGWMSVAPAAWAGHQTSERFAVASRADLARFADVGRIRLTPLPAGAVPADTEPQMHAAWQLSGRHELDYAGFAREVGRLAAGQPSGLDFDEDFYRAAHPDVARAVARGAYSCGYVHFCLEGRAQGRIWSDGELERCYGQRPGFPAGMLRPALLAPRAAPAPPALAGLPLHDRPFLLVLVGYLREDLFFAGYQALFSDLAAAFARHARVVVAVENDGFDAHLAQRYGEHTDHVEVIGAAGLAGLASRPTVTVCADQAQFLRACALFGDPGRVVYFCQDFEAGFSPLGAQYVQAERAVSQARWLVLSTTLLEDFLRRRGLVTDQRVLVTAPRIEPLEVAPAPRRRLFFYYRPEAFNSRNLPEMVMAAVEKFCTRHLGYEIFLMGSVATRFSYTLGGNRVFVISKLPAAQYHELLASCDAAVALIYSAHPGVIAFQAAASGIPTVTNTFDNRDSALLRRISANLVPFDPVRDDLADKVEEALARPRGVPSFDAALYAGPPALSVADFLDQVGLPAARAASSA